MAKALPTISRRGRSFSLPSSPPKIKGPAATAIRGLPGIGSSTAPALSVDAERIRPASTLEIHTIPALSVEEKGPLRPDPYADDLIEIAGEVFVGAHGQQRVAGTDADQSAFAR